MATPLGIAELAAIIQEKWEKDVHAAVYSKPVATQVVYTVEKETASRGDIVHIPVLPRLGTNAVGASGGTTKQDVTIVDNTVTMNVWREVTLQLIDRDSWQNTFGGVEGLMRRWTDDFAKRLKEFVDNDILSLQSSFTTNAVSSDQTQEASLPLVRAAMQKLDAARIPQEDRALILSPKAYWQLFADNNLAIASALGGNKSVIRDGTSAVPTIYGIDWHMSPEVASSAGLEKNMLLQKEAIALAISREYRLTHMDKTDLTETWTADVLYGRAAIRETFASVINTTAT